MLALSCQVYSEKPELRTEQRALRTVQSGSVSEFKPVHKESADTAASAVQGTNSVKRNSDHFAPGQQERCPEGRLQGTTMPSNGKDIHLKRIAGMLSINRDA